MKFLAKNIITILSLIVTIIVSISAYAYKLEIKTIYDKISVETEQRKNSDTQLRYDYQKEMKYHIKQHEADKEDRIERDEVFYRYLDQRFDDMEKLIKN